MPVGYNHRWYGFVWKGSQPDNRNLKIKSTFNATWTAFSFSIHDNITNGSCQFHCSSSNHLFCKVNMRLVALANKDKCCLKPFHYIQGKSLFRFNYHLSSNLELLDSFWPSRQVLKRGWLSHGPARFGPDLKTDGKLDLSQAGRRRAKAWPVDTSDESSGWSWQSHSRVSWCCGCCLQFQSLKC